MTIEKAIEILTQYQRGTDPLYLPDLPDAQKLGIEALKRHHNLRVNPHYTRLGLLPGETPLRPLSSLGFNTGDDESP